ncbi:MAG: hypothetical protein QOF51_273 [Chloroflexota bacterium]|nr:hypothetical protein [Chloroflexota bacterium]
MIATLRRLGASSSDIAGSFIWRVLAVALAVGLGVGAALIARDLDPIVIAADAVALLMIVAILREPRIGPLTLVVVATVLPFAVVPLRVLVAPTYLDLALATTLVAWLARALRDEQPIVRTPVDRLLLGFVGVIAVAAILGTALAPLNAATLRLILKLVDSLLLFFSVTQLVRGSRAVYDVAQLLIASATLAALMALAVYALPRSDAVAALSSLNVLGYPTGEDVVRTVAGTDVVRATGTSVDPNVLGGMLLLGTLLAGGVLLGARATRQRVALGAGVALMLAAIGLSGSRSAWVGLAAGVLYLGVFKQRRLLVASAIGGLALLVTPPGQSMLGRLLQGVRAEDPATVMRLGEYRNALAIIGEYPVFGIGFGGARDFDVGIGVSSAYLQVAENVGLVGLGVFLLIVGATWWRLRRASRSLHFPNGGLIAGLQAALLGALVAGIFDHYFFNVRFPHMAALFWLLMALCVVAAREVVDEAPQE